MQINQHGKRRGGGGIYGDCSGVAKAQGILWIRSRQRYLAELLDTVIEQMPATALSYVAFVCLTVCLSVCLNFFFCVCVLVCTWLPCKINLRLSLELETNKVGGEASDRSPC